MVRVRFRVKLHQGLEYEIEGNPDEVWELGDGIVQRVHEAAQRLAGEIRKLQTTGAKQVLDTIVELHGDKPHLTARVRGFKFKDQILCAVAAFSAGGRSSTRPSEVYQFMRSDGFPVNHKSVKNRMAELAKEGMLIRNGDGSYSISRFGEERVRALATGED